MKKPIFTLLALASLAFTACVKAPLVEQPTISDKSLTMFENINPVETLQVPAINGKITVVTFNGSTICLTKTPTTIQVPRTTAEIKANREIQISYVDESDPKYAAELGELTSKAELWQTLAFEDSIEGDYDYNDLVLHLCQQKSTNKQGSEEFHIGIHPIAYGASKTFRLGCDIYHNNQKVVDNFAVVKSAREELFLSNDGKPIPGNEMLNAFSLNYHCNFFTKVLTMSAAGINFASIKITWFIEVENFENGKTKKIYAVNDKVDFLDKSNRPYGILITETGRSVHWEKILENKAEHSANWFEYPRESINISECYADAQMDGMNSFDAWLTGTSGGSFNMRNPDPGKVFNIAEKETKHTIYQIENENHKDLGSDHYNQVRVALK